MPYVPSSGVPAALPGLVTGAPLVPVQTPSPNLAGASQSGGGLLEVDISASVLPNIALPSIDPADAALLSSFDINLGVSATGGLPLASDLPLSLGDVVGDGLDVDAELGGDADGLGEVSASLLDLASASAGLVPSGSGLLELSAALPVATGLLDDVDVLAAGLRPHHPDDDKDCSCDCWPDHEGGGGGGGGKFFSLTEIGVFTTS